MRRASRASTSTAAASASHPATAPYATAASGRPAFRSSSSTRVAAIATTRRATPGRRATATAPSSPTAIWPGTFLPWDLRIAAVRRHGSRHHAGAREVRRRCRSQAELARDYGDYSRAAPARPDQEAQSSRLPNVHGAQRCGAPAGRELVRRRRRERPADRTTRSTIPRAIPGWRNGEVVPDPSPTNVGGLAHESADDGGALSRRLCAALPDVPHKHAGRAAAFRHVSRARLPA